MSSNLVSVIIPCYNQAEFLGTTLDSVLNQTYINWECLIINDESPDNTEEVAKKYVNKDTRFKYFFQKNAGVSVARNKGLDNAQGDYIIFLDSDDLFHPDKIKKSLDTLIKEDVDVVITNFQRFKKNLNHLKNPEKKLKNISFSYESFLMDWDRNFIMPPSCILFSASIINGVRFRKELRAKQDWFFWIELFKSNPKFFYTDHIHVYYRRSNKSVTTNHERMRKYKDLAYAMVLQKLESDGDFINKEKFITKIIEDSSHTITYHRKKEEKYKSLTVKLALIATTLFVLLIISLFI